MQPKITVIPWNGAPPTPGFWAALQKAQASAGPMEKTEEFPDKKGKHFSRVEEWIKAARGHFHAAGLVVSQWSGVLEDRKECLVLSTVFLLVSPADGTGLYSTVEWPVSGFAGGRGSPSHATATAYSSAWKYWVRGVLAIPQVDEGEDPEAKDGSIQGWQERGGKPIQQGQRQAPQQQRPQQSQQQQVWQARQGWQSPQQQQDYEQGWQGQPPQQQWQGQQGQPPQQQWQGQQEQQWDGPPPNGGGQQNWAPPQSTPQPPRPPIGQEPIVQFAQRQLQSTPATKAEILGRTTPPERAKPFDGGPDPSMEELVSKGWAEDFALQIATIGPNDEVPEDLREEFLNAIGQFFNGDLNAAQKPWEGTGFVPQGRGGPKPTGVHLRRYCTQLDWKQRAAVGAGR